MSHVIIPDYPVRLQFSVGATATAGPFAFNFTFFALGDVAVFKDDVLLAYLSQYTVAGTPGAESGYPGGSVTLLTAVSNCVITILRVMPIERVSDFPDAGSFNRATLNTTLDKHIALIQQVDERVDRALVRPPTMVGATLVANNFLQVNDDATGIDMLTPAQTLAAIAAQPLEPTLTAFAALAVTADKLPYATGAESFALTALTAYARTILDDLDAIAMRATLGLGTMATQNANAVNITGGTITGVAVAVPGLGTMSVQNANNVAITGGLITNMPTPVLNGDVVNKQYVDNMAFGVSKRSSARLASTINVPLTSAVVGFAIDGVALVQNDRFLLKDQTNATENGVYVANVATVPTRATDFDTYDECPGSLVTIQEGTVFHDRVFLCTSDMGGALGTTPIVWARVDPGVTFPITISQGGTGQTTAPAGFDALKQPATNAYVGAVALASQAEVNAGVEATKAVTSATLAGKPVASQAEVNAGVEATKAVTPATLAGKISIATFVPVFKDCRFYATSTSQCVLARFRGCWLTIDNVPQLIPAAGITMSPAGLSPTGDYYVYASMVGAVMTLGVGGAGAGSIAIDPRNGMTVENGNPARTLVGYVHIMAGPVFIQDNSVHGVMSFYNRLPLLMTENIAMNTASTGITALSTTGYFYTWGDDEVGLAIMSYATLTIAGHTAYTYGYLDENNVSYGINSEAMVGNNMNMNSFWSLAPTLGLHYVSARGTMTAGSTYWNGVLQLRHFG